MALKITENIIIDDIDEVISRMQELIGPETFDINSMVNFIKNEVTAKFYFDQKMQGKSEGDKAAVYLWLDTGYVSQRNRTIFISLLKNEYSGRNELMMGLRMLQHDRSYVKLLYSAKCGKAMWLLPFHINTSIMEDPELVMVITKSGEFYHVKTIYGYTDYVKDKITALSLYSKVW